MSIASQITRLQTLKTNIRSALVYKGIEAASAHDMEDFEADILAIETKPYAAIGVTYPSGSTCTCTDGNKTFKAKDTSGVMLFLIPYAATWTVSCTNGTKTSSKSVAITSYGQCKTDTLSYRIDLFPNGVSWNEIDWGGSFHGSTTISSTYMEVRTGAYSDYKAVATTGKIDLTAYSKLYMQVSVTAGSPAYYCAVCNNTGGSASGSIVKSASASSSGLKTVDISSLSGSYYVVFGGGSNSTGGTGTARVTSVYAI